MSSTPDRLLDSPAADPSYGALTVIPHEINGHTESSEWREILSDSHQVVLYNSDSHALAVRRHEMRARPLREDKDCPFCGRPMDESTKFQAFQETQDRTRVPNYFQLLEVANERSSRAGTPGPSSGSRSNGIDDARFARPQQPRQFEARSMAEGYFEAFFKEEFRLGMGANGSVFLCQVRSIVILLDVSF